MIKMYIGLHVKYRYYCQISMKHEFSRQIFEKYSNKELHENPSSVGQVATCGRTDTKNLMFFWPSIMNSLYINYQLDALIIIYS